MYLTRSLIQALCLCLVVLFLVNCGGSSGKDGGFTGQGRISVFITVDKATLQANTFGAPPNPAGPFTNTIVVRVEDPDGQLFPAPNVAIDLGALDVGALFFLDGDPAHEDEDGNPLAFRRLTFDDTSGIITAHFHASSTPGTAVLTASTTDPNTGETVSATVQITVGPGVSTERPAQVLFAIGTDPLFIAGQGQSDFKAFQLFVLDDAGQSVPDPVAPNAGRVNNLRVELLPGRPNGGERLTANNAAGGLEEGTVVNTFTINGVAELSLRSGALPGTVRIAATADRADNNVDNGIQNPITDIDTIPIGTGEIVSLNFTGPFPGAVGARENSLPLGPNDALLEGSGVLQRLITVIAADQFGNPPPAGTFVTFRLIDSPAVGFPDQGRGEFVISGLDGNPEEGGNTFATLPGAAVLAPSARSSLTGTAPGCLLVIEGDPPNQVGGRIVTGVASPNLLSVNTPFNVNFDTGFTVPYTVGCAPHFGNVETTPGGVSVVTDASGVASTRINYPITQLGRRFKLVAEANGGRAGAVLDAFYLGIPDGSFLRLNGQQEDLQCAAPVEDQVSFPITVQLLDGGTPPNPLPAETLAIDIQINDPDAFDVAEKEVAVARAEARLASAQGAFADFQAESGTNFEIDCFVDDDMDPTTPPVQDTTNPDCAILSELQNGIAEAEANLATAEADLAEAEAVDALFDPVATFTPDPAVTGNSGLVNLTLTVAGLPPNGSVTYFISTVGPEILADTVSVTVSPGPNVGACTAVVPPPPPSTGN